MRSSICKGQRGTNPIGSGLPYERVEPIPAACLREEVGNRAALDLALLLQLAVPAVEIP